MVFSKQTKEKYRYGNIIVRPISRNSFNKKLINCSGVFCGAGFETPSEALYLKKKLLVIPMKNQYEQKCNAESLKKMGVPVIYDLSYDNVKIINDWIKSEQIINVDYSESPKKVINKMLIDYIKKISTEQLIYKFNTDLK